MKMDSKKRERFRVYTDALKELMAQVEDPRTAARILGEAAKDRRVHRMSMTRAVPRKVRAKRNRPATDKQVAYLQHLEVPVPEGLTRDQASVLIDVELARKAQENERVDEVAEMTFRPSPRVRREGPYIVSVESRKSNIAGPEDVGSDYSTVV
mgnify:CR=1 FL=1